MQLKAAVKLVFEGLAATFRRGERLVAEPIGLVTFATSFVPAGDLTLIGGRPRAGKTALACQIAFEAAERTKTLLFSTTAAEVDLGRRMLGHEARVDLADIYNGDLSRQQMTALTYAAATLSKLPLEIVDAREIDIAAMCAAAAEWRRCHPGGSALVVIDGLGLTIDPSDPRGRRTARDLVTLVHEHDVAVACTIAIPAGDGAPSITDMRDRDGMLSAATSVVLVSNPASGAITVADLTK